MLLRDAAGAALGWGLCDAAGRARVWGSYLHGLFDADVFRHAFLAARRAEAGLPPAPQAAYDLGPELDRLADCLEAALEGKEVLFGREEEKTFLDAEIAAYLLNPLKDSYSVEELAKEPFISLLESSNHDVRRAFRALSVKPNIRFETKDDYAVIAMVRQGLGVSIMPSLLLRGNTDGVEIRPIDPPASRTIALAAASDAPGPAASRFAEFAVKWVRENT